MIMHEAEIVRHFENGELVVQPRKRGTNLIRSLPAMIWQRDVLCGKKSKMAKVFSRKLATAPNWLSPNKTRYSYNLAN
jgi:hypothetical protein